MCEGFRMTGAGFYGLLGLVFVLFVVSVSVKLPQKKAYMLLFFNIAVIAGYFLMLCISCGPNSTDVRAMKPLGNAINRYLTTKGKPPSLESIPDLPYKLKCGSPYSCTFEKEGRVYRVWLDLWSPPTSYALKLYHDNHRTGVSFYYEFKNNKFILDRSTPQDRNPHIYSRKRTGICSPMSQ